MSLWTKVRARWHAHDEHLLVQELKRESAQPDTSIPDVGNILGAAAEPGNVALDPPPVEHEQEPPQD
ncbi:MAG TPA: hypothetical protein VII51_09900 [Gaiellaceae bacterium]